MDNETITITIKSINSVEKIKNLYADQFSEAFSLSLNTSMLPFIGLALLCLAACTTIAILENNKPYNLAKISSSTKEKITSTAMLTVMFAGAIILFKTISVLKAF